MNLPIAAILLTEPEITMTLEVLKKEIAANSQGVPSNALRSVLIKLEWSLSDDPTD